MADKLLISINDLKEYRPMASLTADRVDSYVREAQVNDLTEFLGAALYRDLITNTDTAANQELLKGAEYVDNSGNIFIFHGLIPMLVYYTLARIVMNNQVNITSFGVVRKTVEQSEVLDSATLKNLVNEMRSMAISYQNEAEMFLDTKSTTYTLWNYSDRSDSLSTGLKFFKL